jgi:hypothetical protein
MPMPLPCPASTLNLCECSQSQRRTLLTIVGADLTFQGPRPVAPFLKYVGPLTPEPPAPLPAEYESVLAAADPTRGAILVAFGNGFVPSAHVICALGAVLAHLGSEGFSVIWRLPPEEAALECLGLHTPGGCGASGTALLQTSAALGPSVHIAHQVPQNDLLGDPRMSVFMSHCGIHSTHEALYHGVSGGSGANTMFA